ncbi:Uncharacterised protein [Vibrio cholerae]|nr:Uncharacterised protein [Vibrio cholerae]
MVTKAVPLSGRKRTMFKLVGTYKVFWYSPNFIICTPLIDTSAVLRSMLNRLMRRWRAKRSLISSRVGIRPRTIRSWEEKSKFVALGPDLGNSSSSSSTLSTP